MVNVAGSNVAAEPKMLVGGASLHKRDLKPKLIFNLLRKIMHFNGVDVLVM